MAGVKLAEVYRCPAVNLVSGRQCALAVCHEGFHYDGTSPQVDVHWGVTPEPRIPIEEAIQHVPLCSCAVCKPAKES